MTILAWGALLFGFAVIVMVASDLIRLRTSHDFLDYLINVTVGLGGICAIATALRALV